MFRFCPLTPRPGHLQLWRSAQDRSRLSWWSLLCLTLVWFGSVQFGFHILARLFRGRRDPSSLNRIAKVEPGVQPHPSFGYLRGVLETFRPAQRWRRGQAEPMENGVAPGCLGNSQWAAGIVPSAATRDGGVKWGRHWWRWRRGRWQGRTPRSGGPGCWSPGSGRDRHPERRSPGWLAVRVGRVWDSVIGEEGTEEPSPR